MGRSPVLVPCVAWAGCRQQGAQTEGWLPTGTAEPRYKPCSCLPRTPRVQGEQPSRKPPTAYTAQDMPTGLSGRIFLDAHDPQPSTPCSEGRDPHTAFALASRQEPHLQPVEKGCWAALFYSSPVHTVLGAAPPAHECLAPCVKACSKPGTQQHPRDV